MFIFNLSSISYALIHESCQTDKFRNEQPCSCLDEKIRIDFTVFSSSWAINNPPNVSIAMRLPVDILLQIQTSPGIFAL